MKQTTSLSVDLSKVRVIQGLPNWGLGFLREFGGLLGAWFPIWSLISKERPDVVHVHNPPDTVAFVTGLMCRLRSIPVVFDVHDLGPELIESMQEWPRWKRKSFKQAARILEWVVLRNVSAILTVSKSVRDLLVYTRSILKKRGVVVEVVGNSLSLSEGNWGEEREKVRSGAATDSYLLYMGSLYSRFIGLEPFLEIFSEIAPKDTEFRIVGDGPYRKELEKFVQNQSITDRVSFLGYLAPESIPEIIRRSFACVIPYNRTSLTERTIPKKAFEFMALGKAVLYSNLTGLEEVLGKDNPGRYITDNLDDMRRVLKLLLFDEKVRHEAEQMNFERFESVSYDHEMEKLKAIYEQVIATGH